MFKWFVYYLLLVLFYALQTTPLFMQILGIKPVLIVALAICVSVFEDIIPASVFSIFTGLLWDISSDKIFGFNALILLVTSVIITLLTIYYIRQRLAMTLVFCGVFMIIQSLLDYLFYYIAWGHGSFTEIYLLKLLPTIIYTLAVTVPIYFLVKSLSGRLAVSNKL